MNHQNVLDALFEAYPVVILDGFDVNKTTRDEIERILNGIKKDKLNFINESEIKDYVKCKDHSYSYAFRAMSFLNSINAIEFADNKQYAIIKYSF